MRQVPSYAVIGNGRLASHIQHYFTALGVPYIHWHRKLHLPLATAVADASHILLLISDDALESFYHENPCLNEKIVIHCSGACSIPGLYSAHPLMTFGPEPYPLEQYQKMPFVVENADLNFAALFPALPNPAFTIDAKQKKLYHALCAMAGNFSCILWQKLFSDFEEKLSLPANVTQPYLQQVTANLIQQPELALTGPLVRGDEKTLHQHLEVLADDPYLQVYEAFIQAFKKSRG